MVLENLEELNRLYDFQQNYELKVRQAAKYLRPLVEHYKPEFGLVLGSGLGDLADAMDGVGSKVAYQGIPNFPTPSVEGHEGLMIFGKLEGVPVIALKGRKHYYEVADLPFNNGMLQVIFPVHVLAELGVKNYFVTNAAGGLNQNYEVGDMMVIDSHINMIPNALLGRHHHFARVDDGEQVERFQPMNGAYDENLRELLTIAGLNSNHYIHNGTYLAVSGPTYETEGECLAFRGMGADAVGMSTAPEVIVARNRGMNCVGMSCITNKIAKDGTNATNHEEVKAILESTEVRNRLTGTVANFFSLYGRGVMNK